MTETKSVDRTLAERAAEAEAEIREWPAWKKAAANRVFLGEREARDAKNQKEDYKHMTWDEYFIGLAKYISIKSKDPSTQVGCVIIGPDREIRSTGFNGFPRGVNDDDRLDKRDEKYPIIVHAEENAIAQAARIGTKLKGCVAYVWPLPPCSKCARLLIQAGISECVSIDQEVSERWKDDVERSKNLFEEAGVMLRMVKV